MDGTRGTRSIGNRPIFKVKRAKDPVAAFLVGKVALCTGAPRWGAMIGGRKFWTLFLENTNSPLVSEGGGGIEEEKEFKLKPKSCL